MRTEFVLKLHDDESVAKKLSFMTPLEAAFDDARNVVPDDYYQLIDMAPGDSIRVTIERVEPLTSLAQLKSEIGRMLLPDESVDFAPNDRDGLVCIVVAKGGSIVADFGTLHSLDTVKRIAIKSIEALRR